MNKYGNIATEKYTNTFARIQASLSLLSEHDILSLQELFLTPGIHAVQIAAPELIACFLRALKYTKIGYIGSTYYGHSTYHDITHAIESIMDNEEQLAEYFVEEFDSEILIINEEDTVVVHKSYGALTQYGIDKTIPIICQLGG